MDEIASTFEETGVPGGFHTASAAIYRRITHFKNAPAIPDLGDVLEALLRSERAGALPNDRSVDTVEQMALVGHRSNGWIVLNYHRIPHASGEA